MANGKNMKMLEGRLHEIEIEIGKLEAQKALLLDMIREESGEPKKKPRAPRSNVKTLVLDLLEKVGERGLNATSAVSLAAETGQSIERASVSSLLSRLKSDGVVEYDGEVYRLPQFAKKSEPYDPRVHRLPNFGGQS